jgi:SAM-dependent methyltransferase
MNSLKTKIFGLWPEFLKRIIIPSCFDVQKYIESVADEISPQSRVLDAGAGQCQYKIFFNKHKYYSIDVAYGDKTWDYSQLDFVGDLGEMPFADNTFDSIICTQVLEHVQEPQIILCEAFRTLKPGGSLYLSAPQGWGVHQAPHDYFRFTCHGLQYLLEKAGFQIGYIKPSCGYFGYLANRLTILPKTLFWQIKNPILRLTLLPVELLSYFFFVLVFPFVLNAIDGLDHKRDYTLNYFAKGIKPDNIEKTHE